MPKWYGPVTWIIAPWLLVVGAGQELACSLLIVAMGALSLWVAVTGKHRNWLH